MHNIFNVSLLIGKLAPEARERAVSAMHVSAFDYYHPVNTFLYNIGIQDHHRFVGMVNEGISIAADEDVKSAAKEFIDRWIQLIKTVKSGKKVRTGPTMIGRIPIKYDIESLNEETANGKIRKEDFGRHVGAVCALADLDAEQVLREMLE